MKEMILKSLQIVRYELPYVFVLAMFFNILFDLPSLVILFGILGFILQVIIYSRGAELVRTGTIQTPNMENFRAFFGDYFLVTIIIVSPLVLIIFSGAENLTWMVHGMEGAIALVTIYVAPFLFMRRTRLHSIPLGLNHLRKNFIASMPLIILTLIPWVLKLLIRPLIFSGTEAFKAKFSVLIIGYVFSFISIGFTLVVFYTACMVLLKLEPPKEEGA